MMLGVRGAKMTISRLILVVPIVAGLATGRGFGGSREQFLLEEGNELYKAERFEEAIAKFDQLLELDPTNWSANSLTAASYVALYHPGSEQPKDRDYAEKGLAAFERTLELTPPSPEDREKTEESYVSLLVTTGDNDKAIAYLEKQLVSRPKEVALILQVAVAYQRKGEFSKALEYFEKRAAMDSKNKEAWYLLGVNCWARSYHGGLTLSQVERERVVDKGIQALETALAIDPDYFDALSYINLLYREKAKALAAVGMNSEAHQAYDKADEYQQRAIDVRNGRTTKAKAK
jgi:tetratricopeptide (TPR) repeat protein